MFYAYSKKYDTIVYSEEVTDLNDTFLCLNPNCNAEYFLKGINSERKAHFCHKHSKPHIVGCGFIDGLSKYIDDDSIVKSSLSNIYNHKRTQHNKTTRIKSNVFADKVTKKKIYIETTKALYYYCIANSLNTLFQDDLTLNDIVIDSRNICNNANFEGITGLRLIIGYTTRFDVNDYSISIKTSTTTKYGKNVFLNCKICLSNEQFYQIKKYLFDTFNCFGGHAVAVLAEWTIDKKYYVSCKVNEPTNIVYKFANSSEI